MSALEAFGHDVCAMTYNEFWFWWECDVCGAKLTDEDIQRRGEERDAALALSSFKP